jgi:hypothetical protein
LLAFVQLDKEQVLTKVKEDKSSVDIIIFFFYKNTKINLYATKISYKKTKG